MKRIDRLEKMMAELIQAQLRTDAQLAKTDKQLAITNVQLAKTDAQLAKTDAQLAKTDAQLAKTDAQLAKTDAQLAKTDAQLAKTDAQLSSFGIKAEAQYIKTQEQLSISGIKAEAAYAKTEAQIAKATEVLSNIGFNLGVVAEEFFYEALNKTKTLGQIKFDEVASNIKTKIKKTEDEFDIVMYNGNSVALVEIKHKVHPKDLVKLYTSKVDNFKLLFPSYKKHNIYLGIGGFSVPMAVEIQAKSKGIAVLKQKADIAVVDAENLKTF